MVLAVTGILKIMLFYLHQNGKNHKTFSKLEA